MAQIKKIEEELNFFLGNLSSNNAQMWRHFACSLKKEDMGSSARSFLEWGSVSCWLKAGRERRSPASFFITGMVHLHFPGPILSFFPPRSNPSLLFSNCMQNDVILVHHCWSSFRKKKNCILLSFWMTIGPPLLHPMLHPKSRFFCQEKLSTTTVTKKGWFMATRMSKNGLWPHCAYTPLSPPTVVIFVKKCPT